MEAIFEAVLEGDEEVARLLRDAPDLSRLRAARDYLVESVPHWLYVGDTGLHLAAAALKAGAARILLESGADPNAENRRGATPLHYASDPRPRSSGWNPAKQAELIGLLVAHGATVDHPDRGGATPLHRAVRARSAAAVRRLLEAGARVDSRLAKRGSTPLHLAVQSTGAGGTSGSRDAQLEIIAALLEHGADPAAPDGAGRTPRHWARGAIISDALGPHPTGRRSATRKPRRGAS